MTDFGFLGLGPAEQALELRACPMCLAVPQIEADLVEWFCAQSFDDVDGRRQALAAGGLCSRHWWAVLDEERRRCKNMHGSAQLFADVRVRSGARQGPPDCPLCAKLAASARHRLYLLLTELGPERLATAPPGWGPCLPHLQALGELRLERWLDRWTRQRLEQGSREAIDAARRYVRSREARHKAEATGREAQELLRAFAFVLGEPRDPTS